MLCPTPPLRIPPVRPITSAIAGRWLGWLTLLGVLAVGSPAGFGTESAVSKEYKIKAAFLYNFTKFVEWPPQHFADSQRPIVIGILGRNPFGDELEKIIRGRTVNNRAITIKIVASSLDAQSVDLLFVCTSEEHQLDGKWPQLEAAGILTVGESTLFADHGGAINFLVEGDKVHFAINLAASDRAGLKISAQLLKLATTVHRNP